MEPADLAIRRATYRLFVELGRAPSAAEVAIDFGAGEAEVRASWARLHDGHALVLDADGEIRMANPFAAKPTDFRVEAGGRTWFANCGWDAFGIGAALHVDSAFDTHCPDCGEPLHVRVRDGRPEPTDLVWHVLVPAARWWNDIGFT
jgi:Alkylmercury lyase